MDDWKLITSYELANYPCGLKVGDQLRLRRDLIMTDHDGKPTGKSFLQGAVFEVLPGVTKEPNVIWLLSPDENRHTWDETSIFDKFEIILPTD